MAIYNNLWQLMALYGNQRNLTRKLALIFIIKQSDVNHCRMKIKSGKLSIRLTIEMKAKFISTMCSYLQNMNL